MVPTIQSHMNVEMPAILYGTAWKKNSTAELVDTAISAGFRGIDTACQPKHYNEAGVGEGLNRAHLKGIKREDLFLQTKFTGIQGQDPERVPYDPNSRVEDQVKQSVKVSCKNLGVDQLDSLVLHGPLSSGEETLEAWRALEENQQSGVARQIGVSNFYDPKMLLSLIEASEVKPATLQNRFYQDTGYDIELRQICKDHGIVYQCFWTLTANPHILYDSIIQTLAQNKSKTPEQIFFRFIHQLGIQILTGTTDLKHMREDLEIFDFVLVPKEFDGIRKLGPF